MIKFKQFKYIQNLMLKPYAKLWLKKGQLSVIGSGRARLLRAVAEHGSISKAAKAMGMSYRHAWGIIKQIRTSLGEEVIVTTRGGSSGGGTNLTEFGERILKQYEDNEKGIERLLKYGPKPVLAVDGVIFTERDEIVLIRRGKPPFNGQLALPGGFVEAGETTEQAVVREVQEELGVKSKIKRLVGVYSDPHRDPRHHTISIVYELESLSTKFKAGDDAADYEIIKLSDKNSWSELAFDHTKIIKDALQK